MHPFLQPMFSCLTRLFVVSLFLVALPATAFQELFPGSRVMYEQTQQVENYRIVLSAPKKINSRWRFEREFSDTGALHRRTVEISDRYTFDEAQLRIEKYLHHENAHLVFACYGLDCGSSNVWANEIFKVKQLYGLDATQAYEVWERSVGGQAQYVIWYLSQRGNQRIYLQLETLIPAQSPKAAMTADPKTVLSSLQHVGYYVIPGDLQDLDDNPHIDVIATALKIRPMQKYVVVGHSYAQRDLAAGRQFSLELAERLVARLIELGVKQGQVTAVGLGPLAPQGKTGPIRLELVLP